MNHEKLQPSLARQFESLLPLEPNLIAHYVPANGKEQMSAFLSDETRNPNHIYSKLEAVDLDANLAAIQDIGKDILDNPRLNPKHRVVYSEFINSYVRRTRLMNLAHAFKLIQDPEAKKAIAEEYKTLNIEIFGEPDETVYRSLLQEELITIESKGLTGQALGLQRELFDMVGFKGEEDTAEKIERFKPSAETVEWVHTAAETLYSGMLSHVPEQATFTRYELQAIFMTIIKEEFGEAAAEWRVDVEPAKSITVDAAKKRVVIPDTMKDRSYKVVRQLVVHELGVHMLCSVMGEDTDLYPLRVGIDGYYSAEEGLGKVMEQALYNTFQESGTGLYVVAGMAHYEGLDFRDIFERQWRLIALGALKEGEELNAKRIEEARYTAYNRVMRIMRGTDELPWFKDVAYYNGSANMWRYLEEIRGDDLRFMFILLGRADPTNLDHRRVLRETASIA